MHINHELHLHTIPAFIPFNSVTIAFLSPNLCFSLHTHTHLVFESSPSRCDPSTYGHQRKRSLCGYLSLEAFITNGISPDSIDIRCPSPAHGHTLAISALRTAITSLGFCLATRTWEKTEPPQLLRSTTIPTHFLLYSGRRVILIW